MGWLDGAGPTDAELEELALRETDPREVRHFQPIARGPLFALLALALVGIAALPSVLTRVLRTRLRQQGD